MIREIPSNDWLTLSIVIGLALITLAKVVYPKRFHNFMGVIGNSNYHKLYSRDLKYLDRFNSLLLSNQLINIVVFAYIFYSTLLTPKVINTVEFLTISSVVLLVIAFKFIIEQLIGKLFDISELIDFYLFQKLNYKNYIGLILIPINILLIYTLSPNVTLLISFLSFVLIVNFIAFLYSFISYQKLLIGNFFYFILYLCALEIGPYIILYKLFNM